MLIEKDKNEATRFLNQNPDIESIDLLLVDLNGVYRGKRVHRDALEKVYKNGIPLAKSLFASDITGETAEGAQLGFEIGDMDLVCRPVAGSLCRCPWQPRPMGQVQVVMVGKDNNPVGIDPQTALQNVLDKLAEMGLHPVVAVEMEFYLIDRNPAPDGRPQPPLSPVTGQRETQTQVYCIADLDDYHEFLHAITDATKEQNIPADTAVAEYAPGQYEINLKHQADVQAACRHGVMLKRLIKGVARATGYEATFMPKPFRDEVGSGTHIHVSLLDDKGNNVFAVDEPPNDIHKKVIGGLTETMIQCMLIFAPNANSYRRFAPDWYVPLSPTWGFNNRTVALRIPESDKDSLRIEHRVAGADANPYLLTTAILAGMHYGLTKRIDPPQMTTGNAYETEPRTLPDTWLDAIRKFEKGDVLRTYLPKELHKTFLETKRQEYETFSSEVTPLEYDWYLRSC